MESVVDRVFDLVQGSQYVVQLIGGNYALWIREVKPRIAVA